MKNGLFYLVTVLIWGSTWLGIKMQLGVVDPMVSVTYRFALASMLLLSWCAVRKMNMRFTLHEHGFMVLQGVLLFGFNYLFFYKAELYITSGLAAVLFSFDNNGVRGVALCILATLFASWGNITSARNQKKRLPIIQSNAYGMGYGALIMCTVAFLSDKTFCVDMSVAYLGSLAYLSLFGSIIAFGCYLSLVGNIGADRAAYSTLLFPLVALAISTIWEGYEWSAASISGVFFIISGNFFIIARKKLAQRNSPVLNSKIAISGETV